MSNTYLYVKGKRNRLTFTRTAPYILEMNGYAPGTLYVGHTTKAEELPPELGPYLRAGMDVSAIGYKGTISHFDITGNKVEIHLKQ